MPTGDDHINPKARSHWLPTSNAISRTRGFAVTNLPSARPRTWLTCAVALRAFGIDVGTVSRRSSQEAR